MAWKQGKRKSRPYRHADKRADERLWRADLQPMTLTDNTDKVTDMREPDISDLKDLNRDALIREIRTLRWKLRSTNKQCGKQGQVIFDLRNALDALRHTQGFRSIGDYRRLLAEKRAVEAENRRLRAVLATQVPIPYLPVGDDNCIGVQVGENA